MTDFVIPKNETTKRLVEYANLRNVRIINSFSNPYQGRINQTQSKDSPVGISSIGTPIYSDLTLMGVEYTDNVSQKLISLPNDRFPQGAKQGATNTPQQGGFYMNLETVIMTVDKPVRIVKTEIQGRDGSVKEYIGADDAKISITGIITGKNGVYPRDEVNRLRKWIEAPVAKGIVSWWLDNMGISDIVIEHSSFPQMQGGYSYQMFSISAISDFPIELKITQPII